MTTIKDHCCGADLFFDQKKSNKLYKNYLKKGPSRVTAKMIWQLEKHPIDGNTMVDIGGGIGALQWWFLENGGRNTVDIDASSDYLKQAESHAQIKGWGAKTKFLLGDFMDVYAQITPTDYITLDKVVCCYPNYKEILEATCEKANKIISLSYPMDGIISNAIRKMGDFFMNFSSNPFRPYIHSVKEVRSVIEQNGFQRNAHNFVFPWHVETYVKQDEVSTNSLVDK